jgi:DNA repair exonuclease SbcCD ATPase subunit
MGEEKNSWGEYSKLVLKELERLNESTEKMRTDMDQRFNELNTKITEIKNIEGKVASQAIWIDKVNEIWSPTQMKEAKDEIYKQKTRWVAAIAIISFIQIIIGFGISIWLKLH